MTYSNEQLKNAVKGTNDYHDFMRSITVTGLKNLAGANPQKMENEPLPTRNHVRWQSREMHLSVGMLWIFYAVEYEHFTLGEAKQVWRYGQSLKFISQFKKHNPIICKNEQLMGAVEYCIKNPAIFVDEFGDIVDSVALVFSTRRICEAQFEQPYEIYPASNKKLYVQGRKYREIVRLIDNMILFVYTGTVHLTTTDRKELFKFMGWIE